MDLTTEYLGIPLKNPLVPSASPLSKDLGTARQLEDAGASALVMYSLFEEEIIAEEDDLEYLLHGQSTGFGEADSYLPAHGCFDNCLDKYLAQIESLKGALEIPVIASLNGISNSGWIEHAKDIQQAGADALELNIHYIPIDASESGRIVEQRVVNILTAVKKQISIPVTCKLTTQLSSPGHMIKQLEAAGADGVALFNRFYQPELNLETLKIDPVLTLSSPNESLLRMHWVALMYGQTMLSLAVTGGIHDARAVLKCLLTGADVTHLCSVLLKRGSGVITEILADVESWMEEHEYESVNQLKGSVSKDKAINPIGYERLNYLKVLQSIQT